MRSQEKALVNLARRITQGGAHLPCQAWYGQPAGCIVDQSFVPHNVTACGSQAAAEIFDQGPGHQIRPYVRRFDFSVNSP